VETSGGAVLFVGTRSTWLPVTETLFVMEPPRVGETTRRICLVAPLRRFPRSQVTTPAAS
jgi:hypothetical protein